MDLNYNFALLQEVLLEYYVPYYTRETLSLSFENQERETSGVYYTALNSVTGLPIEFRVSNFLLFMLLKIQWRHHHHHHYADAPFCP